MKISMRFDFVDLRLFLFVVEAASITHGAARAGMALASASERIRLMEESLGTALLDRHRRGVGATPAGAALAHHAQLVIQQLDRMRGELSEYADGVRGRVRVFANTTATAEFLSWEEGARDIAAFERTHVEAINRRLAGHSDRYLYSHIRHKRLKALAAEFKASRPMMTTQGFGPKKFAKIAVARRMGTT